MQQHLDLKRVRRQFSRSALTYQSASAVQTEVGLRLNQRLQMIQIKPQIIVDLGSGIGQNLINLGNTFVKANVIGLDFSLSRLRQSPSKINWRRPLTRIAGDANQLPLGDASVDLVFSNLLLHWCPDPNQLFDEIRRILKPGGLFLFTCLGPDSLVELRQCWAQVDDFIHVHPFVDMHHIGDGLLKSGFSDPVMDVEHITVTYRKLSALFKDLRESGAANAHVSRRKTLTGRHRFRQLETHYQQWAQPDGLFPANCEVIYGHAWGPKEGQPRRTPEGEIATFSVDQLRGSRRQR